MSDEKTVGILQKVNSPCLRCNKDVEGFLIPDGRLICPNCDPPAVFDRWARAWAPHEKAYRDEQEAKQRREEQSEAAKARAEQEAGEEAMRQKKEERRVRYEEAQAAEAQAKAAAVNAIKEKTRKKAELEAVRRGPTGASLAFVVVLLVLGIGSLSYELNRLETRCSNLQTQVDDQTRLLKDVVKDLEELRRVVNYNADAANRNNRVYR
jgi:uncharacterized Zn finger protein (UPF0148 family)